MEKIYFDRNACKDLSQIIEDLDDYVVNNGGSKYGIIIQKNEDEPSIELQQVYNVNKCDLVVVQFVPDEYKDRPRHRFVYEEGGLRRTSDTLLLYSSYMPAKNIDAIEGLVSQIRFG